MEESRQDRAAAQRARRASRESRESKELREKRGGTVSFAAAWRNFEVEAPHYDRRTEQTMTYSRTRKQKVQILQMLSTLSSVLYIGLEHKSVKSEVLTVTKVLPIALMLMMVLIIGDRRSYGNRVAFGLCFCAIGDVCLEMESTGSSAFVMGLVAGLIGHLAYLSAFFSQAKVTAVTAAPPLGCAAAILSLLWPRLPADVAGPVAGYVVVITTMITFAFARVPEGLTPLWSWRCGSIGAVLFAVSDSVLAHDRFIGAVPHAKPIIAATYFAAQLLITMSARGSQPRPLSKAHGSVENFLNGQSFRADKEE
jgi:uncharacterized membrane protein YhhN